ncbi:hypothetical protein DFP85_111111 [Halomonas ventosae]|uniref:Rad50/SbcC-type AAA domain-containing protein n=1 Tax=Halomonas ventosae TaxID=229007 RepID=A0A4R6ZK80_9GAMM|nr:AAA family ATPase [Halomonas ventosae]TDR52787.1 hypothetical protein DFP85_111111 [Halomonas ventosae]
MKLVDLKIVASGKSGWESETLYFGEHITHLFGPNGCGKTPVVQSIVYCLGYPSIFRNDIYERCNYAILTIEICSKNYTIKRVIARNDVDITVVEPDKTEQRFYNEKEYSEYLFSLVGIEPNNLVGINNKSARPYLATLLPIFFLDQDDGYKEIYYSPSKFIKDQFVEMGRLVFDLPPKNPFDRKKGKLRAKERLTFLDRQVEVSERNLELAKEKIQGINESPESIKIEIALLEGEIENLKSSEANHDDSLTAINRLIKRSKNTVFSIREEAIDTEKRINSFNKITSEIHSEIETLSLNEEARRVFLSFDEICGSSSCQLFQTSSDSYAKNLLYLKDQIKDLERNSVLDSSKLSRLQDRESELKDELSDLVDKRNNILQKSEISSLIDTISNLKNKIFELQGRYDILSQYGYLEEMHINLLRERQYAFEEDKSLSSNSASVSELVKLRSELRQLYLDWLDLLNTSNVSRDITFRDDFVPVLGKESIAQLKGSTRIRAILAYHAALIELITKNSSKPFNFYILDTPKQHEIHNNDLDCYIKALKKLAIEAEVQIVFSTTEYHYDGDFQDKEWTPKFPGEKQKMFLSGNPIGKVKS